MDPTRKPSLTWATVKVLGRGTYGTVSLGFFFFNGCVVMSTAVKSATGKNAIGLLRREKMFLDHLLGCRQVIGCYGEATTTTVVNGEEQTTHNVFLEFAPGGSLRDNLRLRPLDERAARRYTRSMLRGLIYIHLHQVAHLDIKPENVMLWSMDEVKIVDFGLSLHSCERNADVARRRGTLYYLAPECIAKNEYGAPADVWALGCTLAEMLLGKPARAHLNNVVADKKEFLALIGKGQAPPEIPEHMSELGRAFLLRCFEVDSRKRWTAEMLLRHPYMAEDLDLQPFSSSFFTSTSSRTSQVPLTRRDWILQ